MSSAPPPYSRRTFMFFSAAVGAALVVRPRTSFASAPPAPTRTIALHTRWCDETFAGPYLERGSYLSAALSEIDHLFRDRHSEAVHPIDVRLIDLLYAFKQQADYRG